MRRNALGRHPEGPIFGRREEPTERPQIMSVHPFRQPRRDATPILAPYFVAEAVSQPAPRLRPLTALEQMYAYWGSDRD